MRIVQLSASNIKRLVAVEIAPDGQTVVLTGKNGAGKSSVLDSIMYALAGSKSVPDKPIREGEDRGEVTVSLDSGLVITRTFTAAGGGLRITDGDSIKRSPQAILDKLTGHLTFDPLGFLRMQPAKQAAMLREVAGVDTSDLDEQYAAIYQERTIRNREIKQQQAVLETLPEHADVGTAEVSLSDLLRQLEAANAQHDEVRRLAREAEDAEAVVIGIERELESLASRIAELKATMDETQHKLLEARRRQSIADGAFQNARDVDTQAIQQQINEAEARNKLIRENKARANHAERLQALQAESDKLTEGLKSLADARAERLAQADWPVDGLGYDDDGLTWRGLPFDQASSAEQLRVACAMAAAGNPELRIILIRDGSLLDDDSMAALEQHAAEHDLQVWIERVDDDRPGAIVIEDGQVRG